MKKAKKLFLMAILTFVAFVCMGVANAQLNFKNYKIVCVPEALEPGGDGKCYLLAMLDTGSSGSADGVITVVYTSKNLILDGAGDLEISGVTSEYITNTQALSGANNNKYTKASDGIATAYKCQTTAFEPTKIASSNVNSSGCVVTYSNNGDGKLDTTSTTSLRALSSFVSTNGGYGEYYVLAIYIVQLDDNATKECGEICAKAWTIPEGTYYSLYNTNTCTDGANDEGCGGSIGASEEACSEIKYSGIYTETGSFVSYALLAACACIAVAAISIANKNNKVYKV